MIYLTCDIHHSSLGLSYNAFSDISELRATHLFLKLVEKHNVKTTIFATGKCFTEEWGDTKRICEHPLVELGGHNYLCFKPARMINLWTRAFRNPNGPWPYQHYDAKKTRDIIAQKSGRSITSWRNHTLAHGPNTERVLARLGFRICADDVRSSATGPEWHRAGIYNFPINIMPDYDHIYHADRTEEWVKRWLAQYHWKDDFGSDSYHVEEWADIVLGQIRKKVEADMTVNLLIHPMTHYIADKLVSVERIIKYIGSQPNAFYSELPLDK